MLTRNEVAPNLSIVTKSPEFPFAGVRINVSIPVARRIGRALFARDGSFTYPELYDIFPFDPKRVGPDDISKADYFSVGAIPSGDGDLSVTVSIGEDGPNVTVYGEFYPGGEDYLDGTLGALNVPSSDDLPRIARVIKNLLALGESVA